MLLSDGRTERLFPIIGVHDALVDYSLGPTGSRINGSVTEPSISIDGRRVYFSYFHDALNFPPFCCSTTGHSNFDGWPLGGDLYAIDLGPKIDDPSFPPNQLRVSRLTQTNDWYEDAMNPSVSMTTEHDKGGVVYIGAIEVDTELGRRLVFASNRKQLRNSNPGQGKKNKKLQLVHCQNCRYRGQLESEEHQPISVLHDDFGIESEPSSRWSGFLLSSHHGRIEAMAHSEAGRK